MKVVKAHNMTREEATRKIDGEFSKLMIHFDETVSDANHSWRDDVMEFSFRARGFDFKGTLKITHDNVDIELDLPVMLRPFQGLAQEKLEEGLDDFLDV